MNARTKENTVREGEKGERTRPGWTASTPAGLDNAETVGEEGVPSTAAAWACLTASNTAWPRSTTSSSLGSWSMAARITSSAPGRFINVAWWSMHDWNKANTCKERQQHDQRHVCECRRDINNNKIPGKKERTRKGKTKTPIGQSKPTTKKRLSPALHSYFSLFRSVHHFHFSASLSLS
jgi:hypothetical protein